MFLTNVITLSISSYVCIDYNILGYVGRRSRFLREDGYKSLQMILEQPQIQTPIESPSLMVIQLGFEFWDVTQEWFVIQLCMMKRITVPTKSIADTRVRMKRSRSAATLLDRFTRAFHGMQIHQIYIGNLHSVFPNSIIFTWFETLQCIFLSLFDFMKHYIGWH